MRESRQRGNSGFLVILLVGVLVTAIALLGSDRAGSVEAGAAVETPEVAEAPPPFMGVLGKLGRSRGIELPQ